MCGSYQLSPEESDEIRHILEEISRRYGQPSWTQGTLFPKDDIPVLASDMQPTLMGWGFQGFSDKLIINARSETAAAKPMFSSSLAERRCAIPTTGFFEWNPRHDRYLLRPIDRPELFLAGIYRPSEDGDRCCILTTAANTSVLPVHGRMPVTLDHAHIEDWISDPAYTREALERTQPELIVVASPKEASEKRSSGQASLW